MMIDGGGGPYAPPQGTGAKPQVREAQVEAPGGDAAKAVEAVKQAKADMHRQRKDFAAQQVRRLKLELAALRVGGGAGAVSRQVARMARALAAALHSYRGSARMAGAETGVDTLALAREGRRVTAEADLVRHGLKRTIEDERRWGRKDHDGELVQAEQAVARAGGAVSQPSPVAPLCLDI